MGSIAGNLEITKALRVFPSDWVLQLLTFDAFVKTNKPLMVCFFLFLLHLFF